MGRDWILVRWSDRALAHALEKHGVTEQELKEIFDRGVYYVTREGYGN